MDDLRTGAHNDDYSFCIGCSEIVEQMVLSPDKLGKFVHRFLNDVRACGIKRVHCFAGLEERVRILRRPAENRFFRCQRALAVSKHQLVIHHCTDVVDCQLLDLHYLGRCSEPIEEMKEREPGFQRSRLCDQSEIHDLLHRI